MTSKQICSIQNFKIIASSTQEIVTDLTKACLYTQTWFLAQTADFSYFKSQWRNDSLWTTVQTEAVLILIGH